MINFFGLLPFGTGNINGYGPTPQTTSVYNSSSAYVNFLSGSTIFASGFNFCPGTMGLNELNAGPLGIGIFNSILATMLPKTTPVPTADTTPAPAPTADTTPAPAPTADTTPAPAPTFEEQKEAIETKLIQAESNIGIIKQEAQDIQDKAIELLTVTSSSDQVMGRMATTLSSMPASEEVTSLIADLNTLEGNNHTITTGLGEIKEDARDISRLADQTQTLVTQAREQVDALSQTPASEAVQNTDQASREAEAQRTAENTALEHYKARPNDSAYRIAGEVVAQKYGTNYKTATEQHAQEIAQIQALLQIPTRPGRANEKYKLYSVLSPGQDVNLNLLGSEYHEAAVKYMKACGQMQ